MAEADASHALLEAARGGLEHLRASVSGLEEQLLTAHAEVESEKKARKGEGEHLRASVSSLEAQLSAAHAEVEGEKEEREDAVARENVFDPKP